VLRSPKTVIYGVVLHQELENALSGVVLLLLPNHKYSHNKLLATLLSFQAILLR
jgi:hypothetical protein